MQAEFRASAGPILVDGAGANPGTLGAAFDYLARVTLNPQYIPEVSFYGFLNSPRMLTALRDLVLEARGYAANAREGKAPETLLRSCWVLSLTTEVYRSGGIAPGSPLSMLGTGRPIGVEALLELTPPSALTELRELHRHAATHLYPEIPVGARLALGPTFAASRLCSADADMIFDGCLLDIKTHLGPKSKGVRYDALSLQDAYQLVGYALFDHPDEFAIREVAIYSGRYAHFVRWDLQKYLDVLAGRPVDLATERAKVWALLGG